MWFYILSIAAVWGLVAVDQLTKAAAVGFLAEGPKELIPSVFSLSLVKNRGAAFGILQGASWLFIPLTVTILAGIAWYYVRKAKARKNAALCVSLVFIASGAIGNLIDRVSNGYVVDFFYFVPIDFPVFNLADVLVVSGCGILLVLSLFFGKGEGYE
jgi:signal peptidase II